ncbi:MAG: SMP-30/gluconolactonase/LRE family protein [Pirellulaceae bacterium]
MNTYTTEILFQSDDTRLLFLPEGPMALEVDRFSWVAIQHAADSVLGSLNVFDCATLTNNNYALSGRPGFAFPTDDTQKFIVGVDKHIELVDITSGDVTVLTDDIDVGVENTLINDAIAFAEGIVFGSKDLEFATNKAGLYFWKFSDRQLCQLRDDQLCSNGKVITRSGKNWSLFDIDTPTQQVVRYELDTNQGTLSEAEVVLDFTDGEIFPDGMVATPDGKSLIVAFYNPAAAQYGVARQFSIETGVVQAEWQTAKAPRVTCPLLLETAAGVKLVLTTAIEDMSAEMYAQHPNSGSLFVGETTFENVADLVNIKLEQLGIGL